MNQLPQWLLVSFGLLVGLAAIYLLNPPLTKCDSQYDVFKISQTPFLFLDAKKAHITKTGLQKSIEECRKGNNSGACFPFFEGVQGFLKDLNTVSRECIDQVESESEVKNAIWNSMHFIFELAWGTKPPKSEFDKVAWFDHLNISIYCDLRDFIFNHYSKDVWEEFREKLLTTLPGAAEIGRDTAWKLSLFTVSCNK